jgi:acyl-CoA thioesterase-2
MIGLLITRGEGGPASSIRAARWPSAHSVPAVVAPIDDEARFLGIEAADEDADGHRWRIRIEQRHLNPGGTLYGGEGIAAASWAMAAVAGRPLLWNTTRFVDTARLDDELVLTASIDAAGKRTSQVSVRATRGDDVVLEAWGACGDGADTGPSEVWIEMPEVPAPEQCEPTPPIGVIPPSFLDTLERRLAFGSFPAPGKAPADARIGMWTRVLRQDSTSAPMLSWLGDCMPLGVAVAIGRIPFGTSLDNTIRLLGRSPSEWVLADVRPKGSFRGYAYGDVDLWSQDGHLLATATQTAAIKPSPFGQPPPA